MNMAPFVCAKWHQMILYLNEHAHAMHTIHTPLFEPTIYLLILFIILRTYIHFMYRLP